MESIEKVLNRAGLFNFGKKLNKEAKGIMPNNLIKTYSLSESLFGIFDCLIVRSFDSETINIDFEVNQSVKIDRKTVLVRELFSVYGKDSNGIAIDSVPHLDPFGGESYCWYVDISGNILTENEENFHHAVLYNFDKEGGIISIVESQNVLNESQKKWLGN